MSDQLSEREFHSCPEDLHPEPTSGPSAEIWGASDGPGDTSVAPAEPAPEAGMGEPGRRRRRGRRGGRRRRRGGSGAAPESVAQLPSESEEAALPPEEGTAPGTPRAPVDGGQVNEVGTGERRRRRRGRRGGRRRRGRGEGEGRAPAGERSEARQPRDGRRPGRDEPGERSRKRGSRGGGRQRKGGAVSVEFIPGDDDELPELADLPGDAVLVGAERTEEEDLGESLDRPEPARSAPHKHRVILVNARDSEETRVAVVEDGRIVDLQMTVRNNVSYVNDIYRGRVVNLETAIGAAFVDFGEGRNGFLHASDVMASYGDPDWSLEKLLSTPVEGEEEESEPEAEGPEGQGSEPADGQGGERPAGPEKSRPVRHGGARMRARVRLPIERLLKKGQMVAVQITKDAIGDKGPTLTTYVSIPGRYLVLMPSLERTGVSRKIDDERERRRLKRILVSLDIPEGMGVIVRTAGIGRTKTEIKRDLDYLLLAWDEFSKRLKSGRNPAPLYQESDVAIRTMRDLFTPETEAVIVDDPQVFQRMIEFTKRLMPEHLERVTLHEGARPLFHSHGVEQDFEKIFARRVELPSGGSIVIEQTEALVAIDVNSGRTREAGAEFEDIALKTNLEAAPEIARQIRLRDLGGIIVLDYIDMMRAGSRRAVERATREALKPDRARAKIGRISQFGLLELTRQRLGPGLSKLVYDTCPRCRGSGRRRNASSRAQAILRRLAAALALKGYTTVEVRAHPEVVEYLQKELKGELERLQQATGREIKLLSVPEQVEDSVLHYLRADGKEVRPGGRRRR